MLPYAFLHNCVCLYMLTILLSLCPSRVCNYQVLLKVLSTNLCFSFGDGFVFLWIVSFHFWCFAFQCSAKSNDLLWKMVGLCSTQCGAAHSTQCGALQSLSLLLTKRTQWFSAVKLSLVGLITTALVQCSKEKNSNVWPLSVWNTLFLGRQILRSENKFMCFGSLPLIFLFNEILLAHHWMRIYDNGQCTIGR